MGWQTRVELLIDVGQRGAAVGHGVWNDSVWDSGTWGGHEPTWTPLTNHKRTEIHRGRIAASQRHSAGTATVLLEYSSPAGGQWSFKPSSPVKLGDEIRLRARIKATNQIIPIYRGMVENIDDNWLTVPKPYQLTIQLVDRFAELGAVDLPERPSVGAGEKTDARLRRIADLAGGLTRYYTRFDPGLTTLQASNFARNLLDEAQVSVESEIGMFFVDRQSVLVFFHRWWFNTKPRSNMAQLLWSNSNMMPMGHGMMDVPMVRARSFRTRVSLGDVRNYISLARDGGAAQVVFDQDSINQYGTRTHQRHDLVNQSSTDVAQVAALMLAQHKQRTQRLDRLTASAISASNDALPRLLDTEIGDHHHIYWDDGSMMPFDEHLHVQGVHHSIGHDQWDVGVDLWNYVDYTPTTGWDVALWDEGEWFAPV